jgi:hypothetical protein
MTKQTRSKVAEVVLISVFCVLAVYITLVGTVFVGSPPRLAQSVHVVAQHLMSLRPRLKQNGPVDAKLVLRPSSSEWLMRVVQMDDSPERHSA